MPYLIFTTREWACEIWSAVIKVEKKFGKKTKGKKIVEKRKVQHEFLALIGLLGMPLSPAYNWWRWVDLHNCTFCMAVMPLFHLQIYRCMQAILQMLRGNKKAILTIRLWKSKQSYTKKMDHLLPIFPHHQTLNSPRGMVYMSVKPP